MRVSEKSLTITGQWGQQDWIWSRRCLRIRFDAHFIRQGTLIFFNQFLHSDMTSHMGVITQDHSWAGTSNWGYYRHTDIWHDNQTTCPFSYSNISYVNNLLQKYLRLLIMKLMRLFGILNLSHDIFIFATNQIEHDDLLFYVLNH